MVFIRQATQRQISDLQAPRGRGGRPWRAEAEAVAEGVEVGGREAWRVEESPTFFSNSWKLELKCLFWIYMSLIYLYNIIYIYMYMCI